MCLGIPMRVTELFEDTAVVELSGTKSRISTVLVEDIRIGDYVIVHAGFALQVLDEREALETLEMIKTVIGERS